MGMVGLAILTNLITWTVTYKVERETRKLKRARIEAAKRGEVVLDDVEYDVRRKNEVKPSELDVETGSTGESSNEGIKGAAIVTDTTPK